MAIPLSPETITQYLTRKDQAMVEDLYTHLHKQQPNTTWYLEGDPVRTPTPGHGVYRTVGLLGVGEQQAILTLDEFINEYGMTPTTSQQHYAVIESHHKNTRTDLITAQYLVQPRHTGITSQLHEWMTAGYKHPILLSLMDNQQYEHATNNTNKPHGTNRLELVHR